MYAVIATGGKQYRVTEGDVVFFERLAGNPGDIVRFDKIMACSNEIETDFGKPYLGDASVEAKILGHGKDKKIVVFKFKAKKGYRRKKGHRQPYTKARIERIISGKYGVAEYAGEPDAGEAVQAAAADESAELALDIENADIDAGGAESEAGAEDGGSDIGAEADAGGADIEAGTEDGGADIGAEDTGAGEGAGEVIEEYEIDDADITIDADEIIYADEAIDVDEIIEVSEVEGGGDSDSGGADADGGESDAGAGEDGRNA